MKLVGNNPNLPVNYGPGKGIVFSFKLGFTGRALTPGDFKKMFPESPQKSLACTSYKKAVKSMTGGDWISCLNHFDVFLKQLNGLSIGKLPHLKKSLFLCHKWILKEILQFESINPELVDKIMNNAKFIAFGDKTLSEEYIRLCLDIAERSFALEDIHLIDHLMKPINETDTNEIKWFNLRLRERYIKLLELTAEDLLEYEIIEDVEDPHEALFRLCLPIKRGFFSLKLYELYIKGIENIFELASWDYFLFECQILIERLNAQVKESSSDPVPAAATEKLKQVIIEKFGGREKLVASFSDNGAIVQEIGAGERFDSFRQTIFDFVFGLEGRNILTLGEQADRLLNEGNIEEAAKACEKIRAVFPKSPENIMRLADLAWVSGNINEAEKILRDQLNSLIGNDQHSAQTTKKQGRKKKKKQVEDQKRGQLIGKNPTLQAMNRRLKLMPAFRAAEAGIKAEKFVKPLETYMEHLETYPFLIIRVRAIFALALNNEEKQSRLLRMIQISLSNEAGRKQLKIMLAESNKFARQYMQILQKSFSVFAKSRKGTESGEVIGEIMSEQEFNVLVNGVIFVLHSNKANEKPLIDMLEEVFQQFSAEEVAVREDRINSEDRLIEMTRTPVLFATSYAVREAIGAQMPGKNKRRMENWFLNEFIPMFGRTFEKVENFDHKKKVAPADWQIYSQMLQFIEEFCNLCSNELAESGQENAISILRFYRKYFEKMLQKTSWDNVRHSIILCMAEASRKLGYYDDAIAYSEEYLALPKKEDSRELGMDDLVEITLVLTLAKIGKGYWKDGENDTKKYNALQRAIGIVKERIAESPDNYIALSNMAGLVHELGKFEQTVEFANKALAVEKNYSVALFNKMVGLLNLKNFEEAISVFKTMAEDEENQNSILLYNAAFLIADEADTSVVREILKKLIPENSDLLAGAIETFEKEEGRPAPQEFKDMIPKE